MVDRGWVRRAALGLLALLVLTVAGCGTEPTYRDAGAGECVREGSANGNDMTILDCADPDAKWVVLAQVEGGAADACRAEPDTDVVISDSERDSATCLRFQATTGDCAWVDLSGYSDCTEDGGLRLEAVLADAANATGCPAATTQGRVYSDGTVYCWVPYSPSS